MNRDARTRIEATIRLAVRSVFVLSISLAFPNVLAAQGTPNIKDVQPPGDRPWSLHLRVDEVFEDNAEFNDQGGTDIASRFGAALGRSWSFKRGSLRLNADANQLVYRTSSNLDTLSYDVGGGGSYDVTRRFRFSLNGTSSRNYAQDTTIFLEAGLVQPKTITRVTTVGSQFGYDISRSTQLMVSLGGETVSFESSPLRDTVTVTGRILLVRQLTRSQSIGISWGQTYSTVGLTSDIQGLLAVWRATLNPRFSVNASGGIRPYSLEGQSGYQITPGGSAGLIAHLGRNGVATLSYEHGVEQAYGFSGTHLTDRGIAGYTSAVGTRLSVHAAFDYGENWYPSEPDLRLLGRTISAGLQYRVARRFSVGADYGVWTRTNEAHVSSRNTRANVGASYDFSWR
jgi:hypothetical protein